MKKGDRKTTQRRLNSGWSPVGASVGWLAGGFDGGCTNGAPAAEEGSAEAARRNPILRKDRF